MQAGVAPLRPDTSYLCYLCSSLTWDMQHRPTRHVPQMICFALHQICPKQLNIRHINTPRTDSSLSDTSCVHVRVEQLIWSLPWTLGWRSEESQQYSHWEKGQKHIVHNWRACLTIEYTHLENDCDQTNWPSKESYCFIQAICKWDII